MNDYFESEILKLEREVLDLKTSAQRFSGVIETTSKTIKVDIPLRLRETGIKQAIGGKVYSIKPDAESLIIPTLDWYYGDVSVAWSASHMTRSITISQRAQDDGSIRLSLTALGTGFGDNSDVDKLERGESITISVNLTILSTNSFIIQEVNE